MAGYTNKSRMLAKQTRQLKNTLRQMEYARRLSESIARRKAQQQMTDNMIDGTAALAITEQPETPGKPALQPVRLRAPRSIFELTEPEFDRIKVMAQAYANSSLKKSKLGWHDYFLIMVKGMELGFKLTTAVDNINIIQGMAVTSARGMLALISGSGQLEDMVIDAQPEQCIVTMTRKGRSPHTETFTADDAKNMGLANKDNYRKQKSTMLKWRAVTAAARVVFPDVIGGLYTHDEIDPDGWGVDDSGDAVASIPATISAPVEQPRSILKPAQPQKSNEHWATVKDNREALVNMFHELTGTDRPGAETWETMKALAGKTVTEYETGKAFWTDVKAGYDRQEASSDAGTLFDQTPPPEDKTEFIFDDDPELQDNDDLDNLPAPPSPFSKS